MQEEAPTVWWGPRLLACPDAATDHLSPRQRIRVRKDSGMESLIAILESPALVVVATSVTTLLATGVNERRKRKHERQDKREDAQRAADERKRALFLQLLEHRSGYIEAVNYPPAEPGIAARLRHDALHALLNTAAATGDAEAIKKVEYFLDEDFDDEGELLELAAKRVEEFDRRWGWPRPLEGRRS